MITTDEANQIIDTVEETLLAMGINTFFFCFQLPAADSAEETTAHYTGCGELVELSKLLDECKGILKDSAS